MLAINIKELIDLSEEFNEIVIQQANANACRTERNEEHIEALDIFFINQGDKLIDKINKIIPEKNEGR